MSAKQKKLYDTKFYNDMRMTTPLSVKRIIDCFALHLHDGWQPTSIVDLGCGIGVFLKGFREKWGGGVEDKEIQLHGVDGDYVDRKKLCIKEDEFESWDLTKPYFPTHSRRYDLAVSTEVAEHLPKSRAETFVSDLVELADVVIFSAAIPYQGGTGHINEQPLSYWAELFRKYDYELRDIIRPDIWDMKDVLDYYKSNVVVFVRSNSYAADVVDKKTDNTFVDVVHPQMFEQTSLLLRGRLGKIYLKMELFIGRIRKKYSRT